VSGSAWDDEEEHIKNREEMEGVQRSIHVQPVVFLDFPVEDEEAISMLMQKEACYMPEADYSGRYESNDLNAAARQDAISWMLKVAFFLQDRDRQTGASCIFLCR
jgi:cyclin D1/2/4